MDKLASLLKIVFMLEEHEEQKAINAAMIKKITGAVESTLNNPTDTVDTSRYIFDATGTYRMDKVTGEVVETASLLK